MSSEPFRDPVKDHLLTPQNSTFIIIDYQPVQVNSIASGYEVYVVADAVGGTSVTAHEMALRRIEQAGATMSSVTQLFCELQRDWQQGDRARIHDVVLRHGR